MSANNYLRWNLKKIMKGRNMNVYKMSDATGMTVQAINHILNAEHGTSLKIIDRLSEGLDVPACDLINQYYEDLT